MKLHDRILTFRIPVDPETKISIDEFKTGFVTYQYDPRRIVGEYEVDQFEFGLKVKVKIYDDSCLSPEYLSDIDQFLTDKIEKLPFNPAISFSPKRTHIEEVAGEVTKVVFDEVDLIGVSLL